MYVVAVTGTLSKNDYSPIVVDKKSRHAGFTDVERRTSTPSGLVTTLPKPNPRELTLEPRIVAVANDTGGRAFAVPVSASSVELQVRAKTTAAGITAEVSGQYLMGYYSKAPADKLRSIRVKATRPGVSVRARRNALDK